jgi:uncharacterized damage-inducible protein DinB
MEPQDLTSFQKEYLWEFSIPRIQLLALAETLPDDVYGWHPAPDARTFSEVLVHIAAGMMMLLYRAEAYTQEVMEFCGPLQGEGMRLWVEMVHRSLGKEKAITRKADVIALVKQSFAIVEREFSATTQERLDARRDFGGEITTARRIYLRILAHTHEHMGQVIAYAREMGFHVPWPDPIKEMERMVGAEAR